MSYLVCRSCGYQAPKAELKDCPVCGIHRDDFIDGALVHQQYRIQETAITDKVTRMTSLPNIGISAYRVDTSDGAIWIDCPAVFSEQLKPTQKIFFTHRDFMGASDQYRQRWGAKTYLHHQDADHEILASYAVDHPFPGSFKKGSLEAYHIGGHTPGFTIYIYEEVLFICDYIFAIGSDTQLNSCTDSLDIKQGATRILDIIKTKGIDLVCGHNYVKDYPSWQRQLHYALNTQA